MSNEQQSKKIGEIMAKCWADEGFKQRLLTDTNATLKAQGVEIPAGVTVNILENTDQVINYVLPRNPQAELSDADLDLVAGGEEKKKQDSGLLCGWKDLRPVDPGKLSPDYPPCGFKESMSL